MLPLEALRAVKHIVSHDSCADGLSSAILLKDVLPDATIRFLKYATREHTTLAAEPNMLFCDFSPPEARAAEFAAAGAIVLDHHKTARAVVEACGPRGVFADEATEPGVAGAVLAYREAWLPLKGKTDPFVDRFATLAGIHDTWQTKSPLWRAANAQQRLLMFVPREWWMSRSLQEIEASWETHLSWLGELLLAKDDEKNRAAIEASHRFTTAKGTRVVVFQGLAQASDASEALGDEADLVVAFTYRCDAGAPKMSLSLRSRTTFDCSALAKSQGGGGHTKAAGFSFVLTNEHAQPYRYIEELLATYGG